jgi:hypothetical protein
MPPSRPWRQAAESLATDIRAVVDARLRALIVYEAHGLLGDAGAGPAVAGETEILHDDHVHTLAVVDQLSYDDLAHLAPLAAGWQKQGLAVPLFLAPGELGRSLDAFPLEFSQILARHVVIAGDDPFAGIGVNDVDLRRACETQVRSHLLHLREGFLQAAGNPRRVSELVAASVVPLRALLVNIARLHGVHAHSPDALARFVEERLGPGSKGLKPLLSSKRPEQVRDLDAGAFFPDYLRAVEHLATLVDEWTR